MPPKTQREREAEQRQQKLERIQEQVDEGSLVIRQMTDEERDAFERRQRERPEPRGGSKRRRGGRTSSSPPVSK
jgi:hypothetical protein